MLLFDTGIESHGWHLNEKWHHWVRRRNWRHTRRKVMESPSGQNDHAQNKSDHNGPSIILRPFHKAAETALSKTYLQQKNFVIHGSKARPISENRFGDSPIRRRAPRPKTSTRNTTSQE